MVVGNEFNILRKVIIMKRYNILKQILTVGFTVVIVLGCSDKDLDVSFARQTTDTFFSEEGPDSYDKAVIGGYAKLTQFYKNYTGVNGTPSAYLQAISTMRDDLLTSNVPDPFEVFGALNATNPSTSDYYRLAYQLINRMNLVLDKMGEFGDAVFVDDADLKKTYEGEARFMRAYMYFHLALNYGTPPLVKESITDLGFIPSNSVDGEVLDFAIDELTAAAALLPDSWSEANIGRATKGSALSILGKALLHRATINGYNGGDLTAALAAFDQIDGLGYSLLPNFADNFDGENENTSESLFEIQFGQNAVNNIWIPIDDFAPVADLGGFWGFFDGFLTGRLMSPSTKLQNAFEAGDPRKDMTFREGQIKKYIDKNVRQFPTDLNNARVIRLADVILMKAEAMLMSGGDKQQVIMLINTIRERARTSLDPAGAIPADRDVLETDENTVLQWIMDERVLELAGEEAWRWYDLIRWNKAGKIDISSWDFSSDQAISFDAGKHLLLPFPASEISLSSGSLGQNPNY